jgi:hypothetical protein
MSNPNAESLRNSVDQLFNLATDNRQFADPVFLVARPEGSVAARLTVPFAIAVRGIIKFQEFRFPQLRVYQVSNPNQIVVRRVAEVLLQNPIDMDNRLPTDEDSGVSMDDYNYAPTKSGEIWVATEYDELFRREYGYSVPRALPTSILNTAGYVNARRGLTAPSAGHAKSFTQKMTNVVNAAITDYVQVPVIRPE